MFLTWTVLRAASPVPTTPWAPVGATWWQAGHSSPGRAGAPESDGRWWSVIATWDHLAPAQAGPPLTEGVQAWHALLQVASAHGDVVLADGAGPFDGLGAGPSPTGAVALVTLAGGSRDDGREREFFRRFMHVGRDVDRAPGHLVTLVHAPAGAAPPGPVVVLSAWQDLTSGLEWAYGRSRPHSSAVARQREHGLVELSGSLRCAVLASRGALGDTGDPLADVTTE